MQRLRRAALGLALLASPCFSATAPAPPLATGVRQVQDGDLEGAVVTLKALIETLTPLPERRAELARAHLYLGIAHVGLNDTEAARAQFRDAVALDGRLKLGAADFPPKVIAVFESVRREAPPVTVSTPKGHSAAPFLVIGAGAAGVGTAVLLSNGGENEATGVVRFSDAHFATPSTVCNNGEREASLPVAILVNATSSRTERVLVQSVSAALTIVSSPAVPDEVGLTSRRATTVTPAALDPNSTVTLRVDTTLGCTNDFGNPARYNDWSGEVTLIAGGTMATVRTADRVRVDNP
jgi:hypothetical protein